MTQAGARRTIVYCAGVPWDSVQGSDGQLAQSLSRDVEVLWVDPPLSSLHAVRRGDLRTTLAAGRLSSVAPQLTRLTTLAPPFPTRRGMVAITNRMMKASIRSAVRKTGSDVVATLVSAPLQPLGVLREGKKVYYATDDFVAGAALMGISEGLLKRAEARRLDEADLLVAITPQILDKWPRGGRPTLVLPNGCDLEAYANVDESPRPLDVDLPAPVAGVIGQLSSRIDLSLLEAVADRGISLLLVGPVQDGFEPERFASLIARPNVTWVGRKDFRELPSYLRLIDVGLTPYADSDFNRASFPLKTLEYLAAGRPVVSTPLPAVEWLDTTCIAVASDPEAFATATERMIERSASPPTRRRAREFASRHSWDARAKELLEAIGMLV